MLLKLLTVLLLVSSNAFADSSAGVSVGVNQGSTVGEEITAGDMTGSLLSAQLDYTFEDAQMSIGYFYTTHETRFTPEETIPNFDLILNTQTLRLGILVGNTPIYAGYIFDAKVEDSTDDLEGFGYLIGTNIYISSRVSLGLELSFVSFDHLNGQRIDDAQILLASTSIIFFLW